MKASINGIVMHYETAGDARAPAVVLHHPLATDLSSWDELAAALTPSYRVIRFDARGHGASEASAGAYDFALLAGDVIALMDHLGVGKARFVGLSMGGMVGQHLGLMHADRFHSLALVSTAAEMASLGAQIWADRIRFAAEHGMGAVADGAMARWLTPANLASRPELAARMRATMLATPVTGYVGWCHAISRHDVKARLREIALPTLVVVGALDPATPPAAARIIADGIPGARYAEIAATSHMLQVEDPAAFHAVLLPFLAASGPAV